MLTLFFTLTLLFAASFGVCPSDPPASGSDFDITVTVDSTSQAPDIVISFTYPYETPSGTPDMAVTLGTCSWSWDEPTDGSPVIPTGPAGDALSVTYSGCTATFSYQDTFSKILGCLGTSMQSSAPDSNGNTITTTANNLLVTRDYKIPVEGQANIDRQVNAEESISFSYYTELVETFSSGPIQVDGLPEGTTSSVVLQSITYDTTNGWQFTYISSLSYPFKYQKASNLLFVDSEGNTVTIDVEDATTEASTWAGAPSMSPQFTEQTITYTFGPGVSCTTIEGLSTGYPGQSLGYGVNPDMDFFDYVCVTDSGTDCPFNAAYGNPTCAGPNPADSGYSCLSWTTAPIVTQHLANNQLLEGCVQSIATPIEPPQFNIQFYEDDCSTGPETAFLTGDTLCIIISLSSDSIPPTSASISSATQTETVSGGASVTSPTPQNLALNTPGNCPSGDLCTFWSDDSAGVTDAQGSYDEWVFTFTIDLTYSGSNKRSAFGGTFTATSSPVTIKSPKSAANANANATSATNQSLSSGALIAIIVGSVVGAVLIAGVVAALVIIRRRRSSSA